jgi:isopenicillin-N N-acyltransferase-like protein
MDRKAFCGIVVAVLGLLIIAGAPAGEPFRYPEGRHGKGQLRIIEGIPVLTVAGTPREIGEQVGALALKPAKGLLEHFRDRIRKTWLDNLSPVVFGASQLLYKRYPEALRQEMEAMIEAAGADRDLVILGNNAFELQELVGCSGLLVAPERSSTGGALYGRNFDFPIDDLIAEYSLVAVYRPEGKKAFAVVTFPGLLAFNCGINESGLMLGANTVRRTGDGSPGFDPTGLPFPVAAREVLETCTSVDEFDAWIRGHRPTTMGLLLAGDAHHRRVYEITPKNVGVREEERGLVYCTNHFRLPPMAVPAVCRRYAILEKAGSVEKLSVADVARFLHDVNQGKRTIQTMVFESKDLRLHLAIGRGPASALPLRRIDLAPLLQGR